MQPATHARRRYSRLNRYRTVIKPTEEPEEEEPEEEEHVFKVDAVFVQCLGLIAAAIITFFASIANAVYMPVASTVQFMCVGAQLPRQPNFSTGRYLC